MMKLSPVTRWPETFHTIIWDLKIRFQLTCKISLKRQSKKSKQRLISSNNMKRSLIRPAISKEQSQQIRNQGPIDSHRHTEGPGPEEILMHLAQAKVSGQNRNRQDYSAFQAMLCLRRTSNSWQCLRQFRQVAQAVHL